MVQSVVNYDAWNKGYRPPSEHELIHALSYEGARVKASSHIIAALKAIAQTDGMQG